MDDLLAGCDFYEAQSKGLGSYFFDSLSADIDSLHLYAGIHQVVFGSHPCVAGRFPFAIYYRVEGEVVRVYAVIDCRRDPTWIRRHLYNS